MAIKAGQILHAMNQFVVDRIQTAGAGNLNIPTEKIFELGNYQSVAIVRDVPDLSFTLDCLDVDTEVESILLGASANPTADAQGTQYLLANAKPVDIVSPMKSAQGAFDIVKGVAIPQLTLESASYRYGLRENAGEQFALKGDSIFYVPGTPYQQTSAPAAGSVTFANGPALLYTESGVSRYALNVSANGVRLVPGSDYTETATGITLTASGTALAAGAPIRVTYGSAVAATYTQTVHQSVAVKPAAIRGKDIQVYVNVPGGSLYRWSDVQSFNVDFRVTIEDDYEFGNPNAVAREATDAPAVSGAIELKPLSTQRFFDKLQQITGVAATDVVGPQSSVVLEVTVKLLNPDSGGTTAVPGGTVLKTIRVPDARFTIPGYEGRVQQKMVATLNFESDAGILQVYKGNPV